MQNRRIAARSAVAVLAIVFIFGAAAAAASGVTSDVRKTVLDNGLTVITKEIHSSPVVSLSVWYKVGSRNETMGITGISHALEHTAFKGSKNFPEAGEADRIVRRIGGSGNAGTNVDYTVYYETVPAGKIGEVIDIESDRMNNLLLRADDFKTERTVIIEERKMRNEDSPTGLFWEEINAAAFKVHPYGWPIIGWMSDLESFGVADIRAYYESNYAPNNAIVVVTGDFKTEEVLDKIKLTFGNIPRGAAPPAMRSVEPEQRVDKRIFLKSDKTNLAYVVYAYHAPSITGSDSPALEVLSAVLASGLESRLYKEFVETGLASTADAVHDTNQDPYLFYFEIEVQPGVDTAEIEKKLDEVITQIQNEPVTDYELQRAKNRFRADEVFSNESISSIGRKLGWFELTAGDYSYLDKYLDAIDRVTAADVKGVARKYLVAANRTAGILVPEQGAGGSSTAPSPGISPHADYGYGGTGAAKDVSMKKSAEKTDGGFPKLDFTSRIKRRVLSNGIVLIVYENPAFPSVRVRGVVRGAGSFGDAPGKFGTANLVSRTLRRGTKTRTYEEINRALEFVGAEMDISCGNETAVFTGQYLKKDFEIGFEILADVVTNPVFPAEGVETERSVAIAEAADNEKSNRYQAWQTFLGLIYPNHPYSNPAAGTAQGLAAATVGDLKKFHSEMYRPDRTIIVVAGDVTEAEAAALAEKYFGEWKSPDSGAFEVPTVPGLDGEREKYFSMPEKTQDVIFFGFQTLKPDNPDYYTFELMTDALAGSDLTSRLYTTIRENEGLVYYVYGYHTPKTAAATFQITAGFAPENLGRVVELIRSEIRRLQTAPMPEGELADAKSFLIGNMPVSMETNGAVASVLADIEYFGRTFDSLDNYPAEIEKITPDAIMKAARAYLDADTFVIGIAGPSEAK